MAAAEAGTAVATAAAMAGAEAGTAVATAAAMAGAEAGTAVATATATAAAAAGTAVATAAADDAAVDGAPWAAATAARAANSGLVLKAVAAAAMAGASAGFWADICSTAWSRASELPCGPKASARSAAICLAAASATLLPAAIFSAAAVWLGKSCAMRDEKPQVMAAAMRDMERRRVKFMTVGILLSLKAFFPH